MTFCSCISWHIVLDMLLLVYRFITLYMPILTGLPATFDSSLLNHHPWLQTFDLSLSSGNPLLPLLTCPAWLVTLNFLLLTYNSLFVHITLLLLTCYSDVIIDLSLSTCHSWQITLDFYAWLVTLDPTCYYTGPYRTYSNNLHCYIGRFYKF